MGTAAGVDTRPGGSGGPRPGACRDPPCSDYRQVAPRPPAPPEADLASLPRPPRLAGLLCLKLLDLGVHLYALALAGCSLHLAAAVTEQAPPPSDLASNSTNASWWQTELTVLGKAKWTMSFNHFVLLFTIFHIVYGAIATVCDLMFFHALLKHTVKTRYVYTVLPVHRLFFVVICWIDGVLFVTSSNITAFVDVWAVVLVFMVTVMATADTAVILASLRAVEDKPAPLFSSPWRNGAVAGLLGLTALYTAVTQYLTHFSWEAGPSLVLTAVSLLLLLASLGDSLRRGEGVGHIDRTVNFFLCISGSNALGMFSVGAVLHRLITRTEFDSF